MKRPFLITSVIGILLLGVSCLAYGEAFPNSHVPVGWLAFCLVSAGAGAVQAITAGILLMIPRHVPFATQLLRSGLVWLLIGGSVCAAPFLFS
ncbi:MAG: hypothetical protein IT229_07535 [Flavobacteriales bacterium]|nr:hypothetical protein [Flavobacteriales bacterium]